MKTLTLQITKEYFQKILNGEQDVEHRYLYPNNACRYVRYKHGGKYYKRIADVPMDEEGIEVEPIEYDALYLINGRRKNAPRLTVEVTKIEYFILTDDDGNDLTYVEDGMEYKVVEMWYHLGKVLSTENV